MWRSLLAGAGLVLLAGCAHSAHQATSPPSPPPPPLEVDRPPTVPAVLVPASPDFDIVDLVLDGGYLYWAHRGERGLVRIAVGGGAPTTPTTLVPAADQPITSLATDPDYVYFTTGRRVDRQSSETLLGRTSPGFGHFEGIVARIAKDGRAPAAELSSGRFDPADVAVDGADVYWVMLRKDETLVRLPPGTDSPTVVAHGRFLPGSLVVASRHAYWIDPDVNAGPSVMSVSLSGEAPRRLAQGASNEPVHPLRLAADPLAVYWTDAGATPDGGAIVRVPVGEGAPSLLARGEASPRGIAVSDGYVYWVDKGTSARNFYDGSLKKVATGGGAVTTLASGLNAPDRIAVSGARVCWTEVDGSIKTMAKNPSR
jgi:hypothetical protein